VPCLRLSGGAARQRAAPPGARPARLAGNDSARPHPPLPLIGLRAGLASRHDRSRRAGKTELTAVIKTISHGVPAGLPELSRLGRTLKQRAADVLAYFDRPGTSNGPTEAINGRLEHLRGTALGFRNLTNYITRSLLDTGGFRPRLHPLLR
jgi:transposase